MIRRSLILLLSLSTLALAAPDVATGKPSTGEAAVAAAIAREPSPPAVAVELQVLTLPQTVALPILRKFRSNDSKLGAEAFTEVQRLLEKGTAKLLGWPIVNATSGQKGSTEQVEELRFPTEFATGSASIYLSDSDGVLNKPPPKVKGTDIPPVASAFETRNLGITLEVEPTVRTNWDGSEQTIELAIASSHIRLKSIDRWTIEHELISEKRSEKVVQEQPRVSVLKANSIITLKSGEHQLLGVFIPNETEDLLELFIIGAEIVKEK